MQNITLEEEQLPHDHEAPGEACIEVMREPSPEKNRDTRWLFNACSSPAMSAGSMTVALMPILGSTVWMNCRVRR